MENRAKMTQGTSYTTYVKVIFKLFETPAISHDCETARLHLSVCLPTSNFFIWYDVITITEDHTTHWHHFKSGYLSRSSCDFVSQASHWHVKLNSTHSSAWKRQPAADEYEHISEHTGLNISPCASSGGAWITLREISTDWQVHLSPAAHTWQCRTTVWTPSCCSVSLQ